MPLFLRQSTASQEVPLGYFVDSTDGNTEKTGLSIANTDIKVWKTGATTLASKNSGGATHISNGIYYAVLDATDTDTIGPLVLFVHVSTALAVRVECVVLDEAVYDVQFGTTALATVSNITSAAGCAVSSLGAGVLNAAAINTDTGLTIVRGNTCQDGGSTTSAVLDASASSVDNFYRGDLITFPSGAGQDYSRTILTYVQATKTVTFSPAIGGTPDHTTGYVIRRAADPGTVINSVGSVTGGVGGSVAGSVGSVAGDVSGNVVGNVGGNVTGSVGSVTGMTASDVGAIKAKTDNLPAAPASTTNITGGTITTVTNLTNAPTVGDLTATMKGSVTTAASNRIQKNTDLAGFQFFMRDAITHLAATGLTVTSQRSLDGGALSACTNSATQIGNGVYTINLAAADLNGNNVLLRFTATGADDCIMRLVTQPT